MEKTRDSFWKSAFLRPINLEEGRRCIKITPLEEGVVLKAVELFMKGAPLAIEDVQGGGYVAVSLVMQEEGVEFRCSRDTPFARILLSMKRPLLERREGFLVLQEAA
jgi:hypothetical protein